MERKSTQTQAESNTEQQTPVSTKSEQDQTADVQ